MTDLRLLAMALVGALVMIACDAGNEAAEERLQYEDHHAEPEFAEEDQAEEAAASPIDDDVVDTEADAHGDSAEGDTSPDRQLIYTAELILAIYDVTSVQEEAIDVVEHAGGYVSHRSSKHLILRVPADNFRPILDDLSELGDVLDLSWQAQDVTDKVRDVEIRLRNARELRDRLEELLERADTVEDALEIESELERITLEIERIKGQLESLEDRIAYSTIEMHFDPKRLDEMPDDEFILPVAWVDDLGVESLLEAPERLR